MALKKKIFCDEMFDRESAMENQLTQRTGVKPAFQSHSIEYSLAGFKLILLRIYNTWVRSSAGVRVHQLQNQSYGSSKTLKKKWKNCRKII